MSAKWQLPNPVPRREANSAAPARLQAPLWASTWEKEHVWQMKCLNGPEYEHMINIVFNRKIDGFENCTPQYPKEDSEQWHHWPSLRCTWLPDPCWKVTDLIHVCLLQMLFWLLQCYAGCNWFDTWGPHARFLHIFAKFCSHPSQGSRGPPSRLQSVLMDTHISDSMCFYLRINFGTGFTFTQNKHMTRREQSSSFTSLPGGGGAKLTSVATQAGRYQNLLAWYVSSLVNLLVLPESQKK